MVIAALSLERDDASKMSGVRRLSSLALRLSTSRLKGPATRIAARAPRAGEMDRILIADDPVWTSAGMAAGIDLALGLIERDMGQDIARATARAMVAYHRRAGGQSQHSAMLELDAKSVRVQMVPHAQPAVTRSYLRLGRTVSSTQAQRTGFDGFANSRPGASYFSTGRCNLLARSSRHFLRNLRSLRSNLVSSSLTARMKSVCDVLVVRVGAGMLVS
jgi:hypothetical protein